MKTVTEGLKTVIKVLTRGLMVMTTAPERFNNTLNVLLARCLGRAGAPACRVPLLQVLQALPPPPTHTHTLSHFPWHTAATPRVTSAPPPGLRSVADDCHTVDTRWVRESALFLLGKEALQEWKQHCWRVDTTEAGEGHRQQVQYMSGLSRQQEVTGLRQPQHVAVRS